MRAFGQFIIYLFIILNASRVFFSKHIKKDSLVILAPLSLILSVANIFAYGIHGITLQLFILSCLSVIINIHAILRYSEKLFIDRFSIVMKGACILIDIFCLISYIFLLVNNPIEINKKSLNVVETKVYYEGSFRNGFTEAEVFSKKSVYLTEYKKRGMVDKPKNVIVFVPDKRGDSFSYKPFLQLLSNKGFMVVSCDFYTDDAEWPVQHNEKIWRSYELIQKSLKNGSPYSDNIQKYEYNISVECNALITILDERYGKECRYFFITDGIADRPVTKFINSELVTEKVSGSFALDSIPEYATPGYGCIEMTNPFIARKLDVKKDKTAFIPKYLAKKASEKIYEAWSAQ